jgi:hypothetical protein
MKKWQIKALDQEAARGVASLYNDEKGEYDEDRRSEVKRILDILASQDDPRKPLHTSGLIVGPIHSAPGWYKVKIARYAARVVFRLLVIRNERIIQLREPELPYEDETGYIDLVRAGRHPDVYGKGLRDRYKKLGGH